MTEFNNYSQKRVIITLHGLKKPNHDDFKSFGEYVNGKLKHDLVFFYYFFNHEKKSLKWKEYDKEIQKVIDLYPNAKITLLSYSFGSSPAIKFAAKDERVDTLIMVAPTFKISFWSWTYKLLKGIRTKKRLEKKLGKERFAKLNNIVLSNEITSETQLTENPGRIIKLNYEKEKPGAYYPHPIVLVRNINKYRRKSLKYIYGLKNKEIYLINATDDAVTQNINNMKLIERRLDKKSNKINIYWENSSHYDILRNKKSHVHETILKICNKE